MEKTELLRMTRTKLIEEAVKTPDIVGAHGMTKDQLVQAMAKVHGIELEVRKGSGEEATSRQMKEQLRALKSQREAARNVKDKARIRVLSKRLKRLKHKTRVLARNRKSSVA